MLLQVCLLLLSVGAYASHTDSPEVTAENKLFEELGVFPDNFLLKFPQEAEFFRKKIIVYLFFNLFSKHFAEKDPTRFWKKFNGNDFNRITIDAVFYEYLTKFADRNLKDRIFNPIESSTRSDEEIAIDRVGDYLDNLSTTEVYDDEAETQSEATVTEDYKHPDTVCVIVPLRDPGFGIAGEDFPNYCDIPKTSFTCANKPIPGVYADIETGCQVFHACWPNRIDSFLCPIGAIFNQALLTCDFWYETECPSSPLFDSSLLAKGKVIKPTVAMGIGTTSESTTASAIESLDIPVYDGTCQSLITKPLQLVMKFPPAKCEVRKLKPSTPMTASKSIKYDRKRLNKLPDILSGVFKNALEFIMRAVERGGRDIKSIYQIEKRPKLKLDKPILKPGSRKSEETVEFTSTHGEIHTDEDERYSSTTEFPSVDFPIWKNSRFAAKPDFKQTSQDKANPGHSLKTTPLKPSKQSEDSKKHALDVMMRTLEFSSNVLNDFFPFVEKIILDSPRKMSKSKS